MSYHNSGGPYPGPWPQQSQDGRSSGSFHHGSTGYSNRNAQKYPQPDSGAQYYSHHDGHDSNSHYPYGSQDASGFQYAHSTPTSGDTYSAASPTSSYPARYQRGPHDTAASHFSQQSQAWAHAQQRHVAPVSQSTLQPHYVASPVGYTSPQPPLVAPRLPTDADVGYVFPGNWPSHGSSMPALSSGHQIAAGQATGSGAEYVVPCPYDCGTVLTGVHAVGNMTRHLRSQNCIGSGKDKTKYVCPMSGCDKRYIRSDGLKVHLRKRHNISHVPDRNGNSDYEESGFS